jgi:N-carbamoyl-L-amino-acid hydrolase
VNELRVDGERLMQRLRELGEVGGRAGGGCQRLALTDADRDGRDLVVRWMREAGLEVLIDAIGNVVGVRAGREDGAPVMCGSHIDTVASAGVYDGSYGVLSGLEIIQAVTDAGIMTKRPLAVAFFTNEEGVRFTPDMMGSLVYAGGMAVPEAHDVVGTDGARLGDELARIGYLGPTDCPGTVPYAYVELHIEQGPILERKGATVAAVLGVQGISWQQIDIQGESNHAGATPMDMRHDAGHVAAEITTFVRRLVREIGGRQVGTVGKLDLSPNVVNVIPGRASLTVDLRNSDNDLLQEAESRLASLLLELAATEDVVIEATSLVRFDPVEFAPAIVDLVASVATELGHRVLRMPSGAGHDAQMLSRVCPAGMVFVPSIGGISHNPDEYTPDEDLVAGADVLLHVLLALAEEEA